MIPRVSEVAREDHKMVAPGPAVAQEIFVVARDVFGIARVGRGVVSSFIRMSLG